MSRSSIAGTNCNNDGLLYQCLETRIRFATWYKPLGDKIQNTEAESSHIKNIMEMNKLSFLSFPPETMEVERKCVGILLADSGGRCICISGCFFLRRRTLLPVQILGRRTFVSKSMHILTAFIVKLPFQQTLNQ